MPKRMMAVLAATALGTLLAGAAPEEGRPEESTVDLSRGGPTFKSGNNSLTLGAYLQVRGVVDDKERFDLDAAGSAGFGKEDGVSPSFEVSRLRIILRGGMFKPWLKYTFAYEISRTGGEADSKVKDAYLETDANPRAVFRMGQFKVPFSLQELTGDQVQQFVERGITNGTFSPGRDVGVMLTGTTASKTFGYAVGTFNGGGESKSQDDQGLLYVGRIWLDPAGEYRLSEGAVEAPDGNTYHLGLGVRSGEAIKGGTAGVFEDPNDQKAANVELAWKLRRWFATGEIFRQKTERRNPPPALDDLEASGWHVQGAAMVLPKRLEMGLRYGRIDPDEDLGEDRVTELRAGLNWYWQEHHLKLQSDVGRITYQANAPGRDDLHRLASTAGEELSDLQARVQFQLFF